VNLRNHRVTFAIRDVRYPEPAIVLAVLHLDDLLQGTVIDMSDNGSEKEAYAVVEVKGIKQPVIVPTQRILEVL